MDKSRAEEIFKSAGALFKGHFLLTSGKHSDRYLQCAQVLKLPKFTEELAGDLAACFGEVDIVVGPAMGGMIIAYELARQLGSEALFTERLDGKMALRRGFEIPPGSRVLVAEDVVTTGGSVAEVVEIAKSLGAEVVGVAVLVDRSGGRADFGVPLKAAYTVDIQAWDAADCPLCKAGAGSAVKLGSRTI
ncbi:MAG: orotate phosphoribosyltransferase [Clostridiales bacterium]|jgi:orotate phosphoribosyltransferase|nr:orotate phosphoribosyltransferase [Clostridiales bacterium]